MPYNDKLDAHIRRIVSRWKNTNDKKMFGGVCHLINGNMFCGVHKDALILRLGEVGAQKALEVSSVRPFDITGRPMKGWVMVDYKDLPSDHDLKSWLDQARKFAESLPPK